MNGWLLLLSWAAFFSFGMHLQAHRPGGLLETKRDLRRAYREYDELLTLFHVAPVVEESRAGAPSPLLPPVGEVERQRAFTVIRGDAS